MSYGKFLDEANDLIEWRKKNNLPDQHYRKTFADLRDIWIKNGRINELIAYIHENFDGGQWDDFLEPVEDYLLENKLEKEYIKFWKGILRHRFRSLWDWNKNFNNKNEYWNGAQKTFECQKFTLEGLFRFKKGLIRLEIEDEIYKVDELIKSVDKLEKPKPKPTSDKRKINEDVFWELIENCRIKSENKGDFIDLLSSRLEEFSPLEIRRFEKIFQTKFQELNHWDLWALAYIARRGCGDDEFDYFKAWVISKGRKAFDTIKELKTPDLKEFFNEDPQLEEMLYLSEKVYENKTEQLMSPVKVKKQKIIGRNWNEEKIDIEFTEICQLFDYKKDCP
jgi:hypothetical protein